MTPGDRYDSSGLEEAQYQPGSRGRVLKNLLGIKTKREMNREEAGVQVRALQELAGTYGTEIMRLCRNCSSTRSGGP